MKLTKKDRIFLRSIGEKDEYFPQIEEAISKSTYTLYDFETDEIVKIGVKKAIEILGKEIFLTGIDRSAFHLTSYRESPSGHYGVSFNSSILFKE